MGRKLAYDLTHLAHRAAFTAPSGIEKVDLIFARHFSEEKCTSVAVHYGYAGPIVLDPSAIKDAVGRVHRRWRENLSPDADTQFLGLRHWLVTGKTKPSGGNRAETFSQKASAAVTSISRRAFLPLAAREHMKIPEGAIYLNIAQHALEHPFYFRWMKRRHDVHKVFFIHDLLPLDHPEFWPPGHEKRFERRIRCATMHASAFITATEYVAQRLRVELAQRGHAQVPILACPLPPPNDFLDRDATEDTDLKEVPYFVAIGTLEPRKNYAFLLHVWQEAIRKSGTAPKLVIVGKRGWASDEIVGLMRRSKDLRDNVIGVAGLASASLKRLVVNSRGVLFPSFAEGFGLPVIEALTAGVPVVASASVVAEEVGQGHVYCLNPLDGHGWLNAIESLIERESPLDQELRAKAKSYVPMTTEKYFGQIEQFFDSL